MKNTVKTLMIGLLIPISAFAKAHEANVVNNVSTSANSGGNSASSGEVVEGKSQTEVKVYTEINGEVVEDIHESFEGNEEKEIKVEKKIEGGSVKTEIKVEKSILKKIFKYVFSFFNFK